MNATTRELQRATELPIHSFCMSFKYFVDSIQYNRIPFPIKDELGIFWLNEHYHGGDIVAVRSLLCLPSLFGLRDDSRNAFLFSLNREFLR